MKLFRLALILCAVMLLASQAYALSITPSTTPQWFGLQTAQPLIDEAIATIMGPNYFELYKSDQVDNQAFGTDSGAYAGSYNTKFDNTPNDPTEATITWVAGTPFIPPIAYLLVKDGNANPAWYLFYLSNPEWDGMEILELTGFWANTQGAISHVSIYGGKSVPEPATMLLLGAGLFGLAIVSRKKFIK